MRPRSRPGGRFGETGAGIEFDTLHPDPVLRFRKRAKTIRRINRNRRAVQAPRRQLRDVLAAFLQAQAGALATQIHHQLLVHGGTTGKSARAEVYTEVNTELYTERYTELQKDDAMPAVDPGVVDTILGALTFDDWAHLIPDVEAILVDVLGAGHVAGFAQIGHTPLPAITDQVHEEAVTWAKARAAELVGMKVDGDQLIPNPDARWQITESTRASLRGDVVQALEEGWSNERLASELAQAYAFSEDRADTIARTETAKADVEGNLEAYRSSGEVSGKQWILGSEHDGEDECDTAAAMGVVPLDDDFGGIGDPPAHPRCVCDVLPILAED